MLEWTGRVMEKFLHLIKRNSDREIPKVHHSEPNAVVERLKPPSDIIDR